MKIQKRKDVVRKQNSASHQSQHGQKQKQVKRRRNNMCGRPSSAKQAEIPAAVKNVVKNKTKKHSGSDPLMSHISPELITHQKQQRTRHQNVYDDFADRFWFHINPLRLF